MRGRNRKMANNLSNNCEWSSTFINGFGCTFYNVYDINHRSCWLKTLADRQLVILYILQFVITFSALSFNPLRPPSPIQPLNSSYSHYPHRSHRYTLVKPTSHTRHALLTIVIQLVSPSQRCYCSFSTNIQYNIQLNNNSYTEMWCEGFTSSSKSRIWGKRLYIGVFIPRRLRYYVFCQIW